VGEGGVLNHSSVFFITYHWILDQTLQIQDFYHFSITKILPKNDGRFGVKSALAETTQIDYWIFEVLKSLGFIVLNNIFFSTCSFYSALEATRWLQNLSALLKSACTIVEAIDIEGRSTLIHCSDGWDRTPQLASLAELLLDPYYRTIKVCEGKLWGM